MLNSGSQNEYSCRRRKDGFHIQIGRHSGSIIDLPAHEIESIALKAIEEHKRHIELGSKRVKKNSPETAVSIISISGLAPLCVKHFKNRGYGYSFKGAFRPTHGARAIRYGTLLFDAGLTSAVPVALVQKSKWGFVPEEWLVMAAVQDAIELDRYLVGRIRSKWPNDEKHIFIKLFANFLGKLHQCGAFHADLKTCNIVVTSANLSDRSALQNGNHANPVSFSLIDYDDVRYYRYGVSLNNRAKNFAQLFLSTPSDINLNDRSKFLRIYLTACDKSEDYGVKLAKAARKRIEGKSLLYVGPEGDISENWPEARLGDCYAHGLEKVKDEGD